jgi:hypothetical protein
MEKSSNEMLELRLQFPPQECPNWMGYKGLVPVLELLEASSFPRPIKMLFCGKKRTQERRQKIDSYLSPKLLGILEPNGFVGTHITIDAYHAMNQFFSVFFNQTGRYHEMVIHVDVGIVDTMDVAVFKTFFWRLVDLFPMVHFAHCTFISYYSEFNKKHIIYNNKSRGAAYMNFLVWLQYISAKELAVQGGRTAFEANSLLKTTPLHDGLVVEVGESPYEVFTDEGEALLVKATLSLPLVPYSS